MSLRKHARGAKLVLAQNKPNGGGTRDEETSRVAALWVLAIVDELRYLTIELASPGPSFCGVGAWLL